MTFFEDCFRERITGERQLGDLEVTIEAESLHRSHDQEVKAEFDRVRDAVQEALDE